MDQEEKRELETTDSGQGSNMMSIKKFHFILYLFLAVIITAGITIFALSFGEDKVADQIPKDPVIIGGREEFEKLYDAFDQIKKYYVGDVNDEELIEGAINGMVEALGDPYSDYMTEEEAKRFYENISSSFEGIGAQIEERNGNIVIVAPIKGSPAEAAGLRANDAIIEVDGKNIQGMSATEAVTLIRGEKGTVVELTILRPGLDEPIKVKITRDVIPIETVYSEMLDNNIGKIQITSFSNRTAEELQEHIKALREQGMKGLILDIRQNPGGLLDQAIAISSMFVPKGEVIFQMEYKDGSRERQISNQKTPFNLPLVVVIDGGSASASEILAAAVQESAGVPIVGEKSFGKGTAQTARDFKDGSNLKITTAKWLTPSGKSINDNGITPDYVVPMPEYAYLPYVDPDLVLKESMMSSEISTIEEMLAVLGYEVGEKDGHFDETLTEAVRAFQNDHELEQTGVVTGDTTVEIMRALQEKLEKDDPQIQKAVEILLEKIK